MKIPFYGVHIPKGTSKAIAKTLREGYISGMKYPAIFQEMFRKKFDFKYAQAVNTCTSALRLSCAIADIGVGDEVISTAMTMMATNTVILEQFAKPVFADIQYETGNIDPNDIEHRITKKTKAIMVVHLAGYPCDMDEIWEIGLHYDLPVIEDAAHAIGAKYGNHYIGYLSDACCFSFYATKHITTGDGGMFITARKDWIEEAKKRYWYGIDKTKRFGKTALGYGNYDVLKVGYKYNMNDIAAIIGIEQMKEVDYIIRRHKEIARYYREELRNVKGLTLLESKSDRESGNWLFPLHVKRRLKFCKMMRSKGIEVSIAFKRNDVYSIFGGLRKDLPNLDRYDKDIIYIPIHDGLTWRQVHYIVDTIKGGW